MVESYRVLKLQRVQKPHHTTSPPIIYWESLCQHNQIIGSYVLLRVFRYVQRGEDNKEKGGLESKKSVSMLLLDLHLATILNLVVFFENERKIELIKLTNNNINTNQRQYYNINMKNFTTIAILLLSASAGGTQAFTPRSITSTSTTDDSCHSFDSNSVYASSIATSLRLRGGSASKAEEMMPPAPVGKIQLLIPRTLMYPFFLLKWKSSSRHLSKLSLSLQFSVTTSYSKRNMASHYGATAIKGSDHAKAYRQIASDIDIQIEQIEDLRDMTETD